MGAADVRPSGVVAKQRFRLATCVEMSLLDPLPGTTSDSPGGLLDYPDVDQPSCQLLGPTALVKRHPTNRYVAISH